MINDVGAAPSYRGRAKISEMKAFDGLPPVLRAAHQEGVIDWSAQHSRDKMRRAARDRVPSGTAAGILAASLRAGDVREVNAFAQQWPSRFGEYPHLAAGATILRAGNYPAARRRS